MPGHYHPTCHRNNHYHTQPKMTTAHHQKPPPSSTSWPCFQSPSHHPLPFVSANESYPHARKPQKRMKQRTQNFPKLPTTKRWDFLPFLCPQAVMEAAVRRESRAVVFVNYFLHFVHATCGFMRTLTGAQSTNAYHTTGRRR
jgi:hypothetical protein